MPETYAGLADKLARSPDLLRRLSGEMGLPAPGDDRIRAEDAEMLTLVVTALDLADDDDLSRFARQSKGEQRANRRACRRHHGVLIPRQPVRRNQNGDQDVGPANRGDRGTVQNREKK